MPSRMKRDLMQGIFDAILVLTALLCSLLCFADLIPEEIGLDVAPACRMAVLAGLVALIVCWQPRRRPLWVAGYVSALVLAGVAFFYCGEQWCWGALSAKCMPKMSQGLTSCIHWRP